MRDYRLGFFAAQLGGERLVLDGAEVDPDVVDRSPRGHTGGEHPGRADRAEQFLGVFADRGVLMVDQRRARAAGDLSGGDGDRPSPCIPYRGDGRPRSHVDCQGLARGHVDQDRIVGCA